MDALAQLASLRALSPQAELMTEGGQTVAYLPSVQFVARGAQVTRDLLLWPAAKDGYETRLFLSAEVPSSVTRVWTVYGLCANTWWAVSWQAVSAQLPWIEMVAAHLRAFQ